MSAEAEPLDVIAVGAPLARPAGEGYRPGSIDLTGGEPTPRCEDPAIRREEARRAAAVLGVHRRVILDLPNRRLFDSFEARCLLATELRRYRPRIVIGFGDKTPLASPDHFQAMQITDAAVFYSRLTKWEEHFAGTPPHTIPSQLYFRLAFEPNLHAANEFVADISDTLELKLEAIGCYATQFPPEKAYVFERVRGAALLAGAASGCRAGEVFRGVRPPLADDLVRFVSPR